MFTSIKRLLVAIAAIIAVSAPSVAYARFFDYGPSVSYPSFNYGRPAASPSEQQGDRGRRHDRGRAPRASEGARGLPQWFFDGPDVSHPSLHYALGSASVRARGR
jgi:hypothetical protein